MTQKPIEEWPPHFAKWRPSVTGCFRTYESYLLGLPRSERLLAQRRARWVKPFGPMPYYLPFWLADVFPDVSPEQVQEVGVANVFLYHYYTIKDDALDGHELDIQDTLVADVIFGEGLRRFAAAGATGSGFSQDLGRYLLEAVQSELRLASDGERPFTEDDFVALGHKASLAKVSASAFTTISGDRSRLPVLEQGLDQLAIGLQLLDDLTDWSEDLQTGRFTYPLWLARALTAAGQEGRMDNRVSAERVAGKVLTRMEISFTEARGHFEHWRGIDAHSVP